MNRFTGYSHQLQRHIRHHSIHWVSDQYGQKHNDNHQHQNLKNRLMTDQPSPWRN